MKEEEGVLLLIIAGILLGEPEIATSVFDKYLARHTPGLLPSSSGMRRPNERDSTFGVL